MKWTRAEKTSGTHRTTRVNSLYQLEKSYTKRIRGRNREGHVELINVSTVMADCSHTYGVSYQWVQATLLDIQG
eukprot:4026479-Amphidinium_carterae.1